MADITNQQVLDGITELIGGIVDNMATKEDLGQMEARLSRKLDNHKRVNVQHHLATRDEIGHLYRKLNDSHRDAIA